MKKIFNNSLIIVIVIVSLYGFSSSFSNDKSLGSFIKVANASSLSSSTGFISAAISSLSSSDKKISSDTAFLTSLASLKNIKIDTSLFSDKSFISLKNNAVKIDSVTPGRINPFSPIGGSSNIVNITATPKVVTDQPTGITSKTVVLNGTINVANEIANAYFEYGTTANLGTVTPIIQTSLVGTFIKNVLGLNPKTDYFYKACAKINNIATCGEVVPFTTN